MNITAFLKSVPLFKDLSPGDLRLLAGIVRPISAPRGKVIFEKGNVGDRFFLVAKGVIKIYSVSQRGKTKTFAFLGPRDFFGEMALLVKEQRSAGAVAISAAELLAVHRRDFDQLLSRNSRVAHALLMTLCERLKWADREIESLSFNSVLGRLAQVILSLAERYGKRTKRGLVVDLVVSQQELADMAGTAREMVTRIVSRFTKLGCVAMEGKFLIVTDAKKLREWID